MNSNSSAHGESPAAISTPASRFVALLGTAAAVMVATAPAAIINVPGNLPSGYSDATHNLDFIVGAGNSGRLQGDFYTHWNASQGSFSVPVDTNGYVLRLDSGGGNAGHVASGPISGTGSITVSGGPHWSGNWDTVYTIAGSTSNTYSGTTGILRGTVVLDKSSGADALLGSITVGSASETARLVWGASDQINDQASVTILLPTVSDGVAPDANLNFLDLAGFSETIASLTLADDGARTQIRTGAGGVLTVGSLTVNGMTLGEGTYTAADGFVTGSGSVVVIPETGAALSGGIGLLLLLSRRRRI